MTNSKIVIAGGGIGGLSAALGLSLKGFDVVVLEKAARFGEIGAGIQLGPNAFHALDYFGVGTAARERAVYVDMLRLMDAVSGEEITHIPLDAPFRERFGNPYAVIHRADLHGVLLDACRDRANVELVVDAEAMDYDQAGAGVWVRLENGRHVEGAALIGADGLWSNIRARVAGDGAPRVSGHSTYRSVIPLERMPEELRWNAATLWAGPKCHIVHYPLSDWKYFNLVVTYHNDAPEPVAGQPVSKDEVRAGFTHIHESARQIIEIGDDWRLWVLCDRDPIETWVDGRVALLGDAAHPMMQYYAQGACMAMEDAVCLSHNLAGHRGEIHAGLVAYQDQRRVRTARVQLGSRAIGDHVYHADGMHARVRNEIMSGMSVADYYDRLSWLYGSTGLTMVDGRDAATG